MHVICMAIFPPFGVRFQVASTKALHLIWIPSRKTPCRKPQDKLTTFPSFIPNQTPSFPSNIGPRTPPSFGPPTLPISSICFLITPPHNPSLALFLPFSHVHAILAMHGHIFQDNQHTQFPTNVLHHQSLKADREATQCNGLW